MNELRSRIDWFDEERRKGNKRITELEHRLSRQERELQDREQRISQLEEQLGKSTTQLSRLTQVDTQLKQFKDEIVHLIEQYDQRRILAGEELERLHRVQQEVMAREMADLRKELPLIGRLQNDMELRQAEESRLANLIGTVQNKVTAIDGRVETWSNDLSYLEESGRQSQRTINQLQTNVLEINKRWDPLQNRLDILSNNITKAEAKLQSLGEVQTDVGQNIKQWAEQIQIGEYERNQRLEEWHRLIEEHEKRLDQFQREWVSFADQYKEAKMAVQTLNEFQQQVEQQQREMSELVRVETNRMQTRWDTFLHDNDKRWKTYEVDTEQRWSSGHREHKQLAELVAELEEMLTQLEQEKDTLWRVQTAQADAMKLLPRIWLEEIEKAVSQNPNRRRQPALVPVREE